ncbi:MULTISPECIES: hypothetical protein [unclassified Lysinibacillus]
MEEAFAVEMSISTFGIKKAFEETYHSLHFTYYLLRLDGKACCTANILSQEIKGGSRV